MSFNMLDLIEKKRTGKPNSKEELQTMVAKTISKELPDYQLAAWLMAVCFNGLNDDELMYFTQALADSGERYTFPADMHIVDKHSTGGVGDKATLILLPLASCCGASVSKLSGPALGYTGGTVDKFESIPGMNMKLDSAEFLSQVRRIGCAVSGHSKELAPAEGIFYKLRDVTGTVPSIPLITSSIVSKKLAGGAASYVFDVKCGSGAFMKDRVSAEALAHSLAGVSKKLGKRAVAVITDMEQPLGEWVGNAAEVYEAIEVLSGRGPDDTRELCVTLCGHMLALAGAAASAEEGRKKAERAMADGSALSKLEEIITSQGGKAEVVRQPLKILPRAAKMYQLKETKGGVISRLDALSVGEALRALGGGRMKLGDKIDYSAAIRLNKKIGCAVKAGESVIDIFYNDDAKLKDALVLLEGCWSTSSEAEKRSLIIETVG